MARVSRRKDLSGRFVLVFDPVWNFGPTAPILPADFGLRIIGGRKGYRVASLSTDEWADLKRWLKKHLPRAPAATRRNPGGPLISRAQPHSC
jgi:hypothetical protein